MVNGGWTIVQPSLCLSFCTMLSKIDPPDTAMLLLPPPYVLHQVQDTVKVD